MKKITVIGTIAAVIFAIGITQADAGERDRGHGNRDTMKMLKQLDLSDDQKTQIKGIFEASRKESRSENRMSARHELMRLDPSADDYDAQVSQLADQAADNARQLLVKAAETKQKISNILTEEQRAELKQKMQERHDKRVKMLEKRLEKMKNKQRLGVR